MSLPWDLNAIDRSMLSERLYTVTTSGEIPQTSPCCWDLYTAQARQRQKYLAKKRQYCIDLLLANPADIALLSGIGHDK